MPSTGPDPEVQELISTLQAQGWTLAKIFGDEAGLGRDTSMYYQFRRGRVSGRGWLPQLRAMVDADMRLEAPSPHPVPRRLTKTGRTARVVSQKGRRSRRPADPARRMPARQHPVGPPRPGDAPQPTARELLAQIRTRHPMLTTAQIARMVGCSPRMINKIESGISPGWAYTRAFSHILMTGGAPSQEQLDQWFPPKRDKAGRIVPRQAAEEVKPTTTRRHRHHFVPTDPQGRWGRWYDRFPKSEGPERRKGAEKVRESIADAASRGGRITVTATFTNGVEVRIGQHGGYAGPTVWDQIEREYGGDPLAWITGEATKIAEARNREGGGSPGWLIDAELVGVDVGVFTAIRPARQSRSASDYLLTREERR